MIWVIVLAGVGLLLYVLSLFEANNAKNLGKTFYGQRAALDRDLLRLASIACFIAAIAIPILRT